MPLSRQQSIIYTLINNDGSEAIANTQKPNMFNFISLVVLILKVYFSWGSRELKNL